MTTVSGRVAEVLAQHVEDVFALMGNGNAYLVDALARTPVRLTAVRHEAATVASADAYFRIRRRLAAATTTYGPGYTNALTSLTEAALARTPLLLVVGQGPSGGPRPWDIDQETMATAVGVSTFTVTAEDPGAVTLRAIFHALSRQSPAVLAIPYDLASVVTSEILESLALPALPPAPIASSSELERVADLLRHARRPLILAGRGAHGAGHELGALADGLGAVTVASAPAHGLFAGRAYDLGVCGGFASDASRSIIEQADVVLAVGVGLNQFTTSFGQAFAPDAKIVQVDVLEGATNPCVDLFVRSDAKAAASSLLGLIREPATSVWGGGVEEAATSATHLQREDGSEYGSDGRLDPRAIMRRLNSTLPTNRQVVSDGGHFIGWANTYLDLPRADSWVLVGAYFQSIGLGLPSAPGAVAASPRDTIVVVTGDGGGLMGISELESVVRTATSAIVLVFNDAAYGAEVHQYGALGLADDIMLIDEINFAAIGRALGAAATVVETLDDLSELEEWIARGAQGTFLADLRVSRTVVAPYQHEINKVMRERAKSSTADRS